MKRINDTAFLVFSRDQSSVSVTCQLDTVLVDVKGMKTVNVKPGCTAFAGGYTFRSAIQPVTRVQHVVSVFPERFLSHLNLSTALINDTLGQYESLDLRALEQGGQKLKNLKAWVIKSQSLVWMWVILAAVLILLSPLSLCAAYTGRSWSVCGELAIRSMKTQHIGDVVVRSLNHKKIIRIKSKNLGKWFWIWISIVIKMPIQFWSSNQIPCQLFLIMSMKSWTMMINHWCFWSDLVSLSIKEIEL